MKYYRLYVTKTTCSEVYVEVPDGFYIKKIEFSHTKDFDNACRMLGDYDWEYPDFHIDSIEEVTQEVAKMFRPYVIKEKT